MVKTRHSAFSAVSSFDALHLAWKYMLRRASARSRRSHGVDSQTILDFDRNPSRNCHTIANDLRHGSFAFSSLIAHLIPKDDGRNRVICVPTVRDRIVQRSISDYLASGDRCKLNTDVSYGFLQGKSVKHAAMRAKTLRNEHQWAYKTDITRFFDEIERNRLHEVIGTSVRDRSLHKILKLASCCEIEEAQETRRTKIKKEGIIEGRGVRQGMPLSPFFANLILRRFDRSIDAKGIKMIRYADDLLCLAHSESECHDIHGHICKALQTEGFSVPPPGANSKTKFYPPDEPAEFLGVSLRLNNGVYVIEVGCKQTEKVKQRIRDSSEMQHLLKSGIQLSGFFKRLDGIIDGYDGAYKYCDNYAHFQTILDSVRSQAIIRMFEALGINLSALSSEKRRFLGIEE
ncbi:MAG: reverse transcriptase domain-containing protein [Steroidobacteraceae bacterium]